MVGIHYANAGPFIIYLGAPLFLHLNVGLVGQTPHSEYKVF